MALKEYSWRGGTWQFEEGQQPSDAVEVKPAAKAAPKHAAKARRAANKSRSTQAKEQ